MSKSQCVVCGEFIEDESRDDHLSIVHPAPFPNGYRFFIDMKPFFTNKPSMTVAELKRATNCGNVWPLFVQRGHERVYFSDAEAVDLTQEPHFYVDLPAYGGGAPI